MALPSSPHRSPRGPEAGGKFGASRRRPAAPPSDSAVAPIAALLSWQPAFVSRASVAQKRGRTTFLLEPIRGLQAQRARRRASSLGSATTRPQRSSLRRHPAHHRHDVAHTLLYRTQELRYGPSGVVPHDCHTGPLSHRVRLAETLVRTVARRAGRLDRVLGATPSPSRDHLHLCPTTASNLADNNNKDSAGARE
ncbi:uncharacterized protein LOC144166911 isoform X1 [Haemaphysalis longicornis]